MHACARACVRARVRGFIGVTVGRKVDESSPRTFVLLHRPVRRRRGSAETTTIQQHAICLYVIGS